MKKLLSAAFKWAKRRATEPSTYVGIGTVIAATVSPKLGAQIGANAQIAAVVFGSVLAAATTSKHPPLEEIV